MKADLIIFSGQSNMQGQTESLPLKNSAVKHAYEYKWKQNSLCSLRHPVGEDFGDFLLAAHEGHGNLIPDFCRSYMKECKHPVVAVSCAKGGTMIKEWLNCGKVCRYQYLLNKVNACKLKMQVEKIEIGHILFVWLQGESDAINSVLEEDYIGSLIMFHTSLKKDLNIEKFMIIRVGKFTNDQRDREIVKAQEKICQKNKDFILLTRITAMLTLNKKYINPQAEGHYNNLGMKIIGTVAGNNAAKYVLDKKIILEKE